MRIALFLSFLAIYSLSFGQKTISGQVIDKETKLPLKGANIVIFGSTTGTITNDSGYFKFEPKYKNSMARISYVGYSYYDIKLVPKKSILAELTTEVTMITPMNICLGEYSGPSQYVEYKEPESEFLIEEEIADQAFIIIEESANFYKGLDNLYAYFAANFRYPKKVLDENLSGTVFIEFTVLSDGSVDKVKFLKDDVLDVVKIELERLFAEMPNWTPATQRGVNVKQTFALAIQYAGQIKVTLDTLVKPEHDKCLLDVPINNYNKDVDIAEKFEGQELLIAAANKAQPYIYYEHGTIEVDLESDGRFDNIFFNPIGNTELEGRIYRMKFTHKFIRVYDAQCVFEIEGL